MKEVRIPKNLLQQCAYSYDAQVMIVEILRFEGFKFKDGVFQPAPTEPIQCREDPTNGDLIFSKIPPQGKPSMTYALTKKIHWLLELSWLLFIFAVCWLYERRRVIARSILEVFGAIVVLCAVYGMIGAACIGMHGVNACFR